MPSTAGPDVGERLANVIKSTCSTYGWSQRELAARLGTNQSAIRRLVRGGPTLDVGLLTAALDLLGIRLSIDADPVGIAARRDQRDAVHARCCAYCVGSLKRRGWLVVVEVEVGEGRFRGWIDILAFRPSDGALLVIEVKTEIDDLGRTLRSLGWYVRSSRDAALRLGWRPRRIVPVLFLLATVEAEARLAANVDLIRASLPGQADQLCAWIDDPRLSPAAATLGLIDPRSRRREWLRRTRSDGRRSTTPYANLAAAAAIIRPAPIGRPPHADSRDPRRRAISEPLPPPRPRPRPARRPSS
jgi:transcriptional regulator with XRE-family HTH domain